LDGLRQEKFNLNLPTGLDLFPQSGKGNFAVNAATLTHTGSQVKPDFLWRYLNLNPNPDLNR
jgi:hypothetical protein